MKYGKNLAAPRDSNLFEGERILVRRIVGKTLISAYTNNDYVTSQLLQIVKPYNPTLTKFILGIINSKVMSFYFRKKFNRQDKTFPEIRIYELASLPIKIINNSNNRLQNEIIKYVDQLLLINQEKLLTKLETNIAQIERKVDYCENRINEIVYALYELTSEEIKIVEGK